LLLFFLQKLHFLPNSLPVLVEGSAGMATPALWKAEQKNQYPTPTPAVSPSRWVKPAGRGAATISLAVRHGVPMTVGRAPVFCHAAAISLS
jgi:hypothetical protein